MMMSTGFIPVWCNIRCLLRAGLFFAASAAFAVQPPAALLNLDSAAQLASGDGLQIRVSPATANDARSALRTRAETAPSMAWNETALEAIAKYRLNPLRAARLLAHLHAGMHDAAVQCDQRRTDVRCMRIAQHLAAGRILEHFFPEETPGRFLSIAVSSLAAMDWSESSPADQASTAFGKTAAWAAILRSLDDGADRTLDIAIRPSPQPGTWRPSPPLFALNPTEQGAPKWKTWLLRAGDEILPPPPLAYGADAYVAEMREVWTVTRNLTARQKRIAEEWNLDVGTATPPGVWNRHAMRLAASHNLDPLATTQLLTDLNLAMFDALIACWNAKLKWWTERPITEIRERFDPAFEPYLVTPPFPGYVSGHASTSGAAAYVLAARIPKVRREVMAMAEEAALSRLYGGIHVRSDNDAGLKLGFDAGRLTIERMDRRRGFDGQSANR